MTIFLYLLSIIGIISTIVFITDACITFNEWQQRIHIGRWKERISWQQAIEKKAQQWIKHSPTVKIKDQKRLILWDMLRGCYRSKNIQLWQDAALLIALDNHYSDEYIKLHPNIFDEKETEVEIAFLAYSLKIKKQLTQENEIKVKKLFQPYTQNNSTIPYRKQLPNIRFVDTIGLICPFLNTCGYDSLATEQIKEYDNILLNGIFPPHAYNKESNTPMGIFDWCRGIGWYILGITETAALPGNKERIFKLTEAVLPFQKKDGGFSCMIFNKNGQTESSGTALMGLLFIKAYELSENILYLRAAQKAEEALMKITRRNGIVDYAQGDTKGISYYSNAFSAMPFAQGMTLYLSKKLNIYEKSSC